MDGRRPVQEPYPRQHNVNWRECQDAGLPQRGRNRAINAPGYPQRGAAQPGGNLRVNNNPLPPGQREGRYRGAGRYPNQGRRNQGAQANDGPRGQWNEQENEARRRRNESQDGGRGRRIHPCESPCFHQNPVPGGAQCQEPNKQPQQLRRIGYKFLDSLLQKDPSEVVITLASSSGLKELLSQTSMKPSFLQLICQVLRRACSSRMDRQSVQQLLGMVKESNFLKICLPQYVADMMTEAIPAVRHQFPEHISNIISLLQDLMSIFPASSVQKISMLMSVLPVSINALRASGVDITEQIEKNLEKVLTLIQHLQEKRREGTLRADNYTLVQPQADGQEETYRTMTIYPTYNEVHRDKKPFLRPNIVSGRYDSTSVYLDTHFRLLREDFVRPLREGILELLQNFEDKGLRKRKFDDIRIYFDTRIITPLCSSSGIVYKVQFDTKPLKFVRWQNSKRLLYGSLVCMSKDNFETFLFATVSNRDNADLSQGIVQLCFNEHSQALLAEVQPSDSFLMVETTAYFEAYRHVLEGLQEIQEEDIPFQKYIVECDVLVKEPAYLAMGSTYNLAPLIEEPSPVGKEGFLVSPDDLRRRRVNVLDPNQWPSMEALKLDESQMQALQLALTKELAIIQGPPGTGKTYVGLKIVQAFLTNEQVWQSTLQKFPILVVCYTNHALDQFLEGIYTSQKSGIVRVGGRSSSEILKQFTLRELRKKCEFRRSLPTHLRRAYMNIITQMKQSEQELGEGARHLECTAHGVLHERHLERYITIQHWDSLMNGLDDECFYYKGSRNSMILEWLGLGVTAFTQNGAENPVAENAGGQQDGEEEQEGEEEGEQLLEIPEEADLIQADRVIEEEEAARPQQRREDENGDVMELANMLLAMKLEKQGQGAAQPQQEAVEWEMQPAQRRKMKQKMRAELCKLNAMTEAEARGVQDLWQLDLSSRWRLYRRWLQMYQGEIRRKILQHEQQYQVAAERLAELRLQEDLCILKEALVVGMTTTGAAKYRQILQKVEPRIVIVEEAAEVLEAHTITTLSKACQHLILIGDHQQLRPSANVYDLAKNFNLEMSLFERLVKVGFPFVRLNYQHRMRPEIAQLLTPHIYRELENHPSVLKYENIKGILSNLFFVEHDFPEQETQEGKSHQNPHEAQFVVELCKYFLCQDYLPSQITILTTYTGQLFCLRKLMPAKIFTGVKVHVVDKYQGEENDIILLSLVRSNKEEKAGFLQISNRICVALSRAKKGLYCIGNMGMLGKVPLWSKIIHTLWEKGHIGRSLMLCCQNHPDTRTLVSKGADFCRVPEGGCTRPCEFRLNCGHVCTRACHPYDLEHKEFQCMKPCQKVLCKDGHRCPQLCFERCGPCMVKVLKTIPKCGHQQMVPCSTPESEFCCQEPCQKYLKCGHRCSMSCGQECSVQCLEMVMVTLKCGHNQQVKCWITVEMKHGMPVKCKTKCPIPLDCGHACPGSCHTCFEGRFHEQCKSPCKRFLICSHKCQQPCTRECPPCQQACQNRCIHSQCKKKCGEMCIPCMEPCEWRCQHYQCTKLCSEPCNRPRCDVPCTKLLRCGHTCIGLCGEPCPKKCRVCHQDEITQIFFGFEDEPDARFVELEDCDHIFEAQGLDHYMDEDEIVIKLKVCPSCQTVIRKNLRYGTIVKRRLEEIERVKERIQGPVSEIETRRHRLQGVLEGKAVLRRNLSIKYLMLEEKLTHPDLSTKSIGLLENLIGFYGRLGELMSSLNKLDVSEKEGLRRRLAEIQEWLDKPRLSFTGQELSDLQSEIQRLTYLVSLLARCKTATAKMNTSISREIATLQQILEGTKKFTQEDEKVVKMKMEELKTALPESGLGISEEERVQIVSAFGYPQGHWFKCPNGHIYVIGDCGGAMERSKCPECKAVIGGVDHTLEHSNRLAPEMDGATHAAWSETANNMLNFEDLRRLI
ncbi:NFX1-type zinc finger-containing protein 1 [Gopherus evgoodei]|uniref:Zinc finger NFX1-type containing 1 n=1 Tax=Gopherus evgoodei TaxID=1825980 RepID=A0A8C5F1J8_9SAUR|nr:NFX1-type zinc finger-containing protein 1 [Gopherus evgoodei]XP_030388738.1 NFX1-type zinc finger-containing protein 1 [Gopherus evgoodei]XP_030388739.1 NFX1-type zinc finger-containing protein 1 [Gopherus evgoodei]XP_030388740.1 NFX1-type zinc finger-containing protein 1 [Gopherus evgoodei]XP_030388741.1 NFX1-type zinc finger-containing protein 1 [Gopherus evgoodei]XP_030388742.1 NFX1-type zinc finger-containing protein 1 [Gopherus evgoodei]